MKIYGKQTRELKRTLKKVLAENKNHFLDNEKLKFISKELIEIILLYNLEKEIRKYDEVEEKDILQIAYNSSVTLFETWLEGGCHVIGNGHALAQIFAEKFVKEFKLLK